MERFYWGPENVIHNSRFEDGLVKLYREILLYEAKCAWYFSLKTPNRMMRNILQVDGWADLLKNIEGCETQCLQFSQILSHSNQAKIQAALRQQLEDIKMSIDRLYQTENHNTKIITWISDVPVFQDHNYVRTQKLTPDHWASGTWLLNNTKFIEWTKATQGQIWLQGTMGTGKSCLTSIIINHLLETFPDNQLAFFYCSGNRKDSATVVFRSLVAQLSCAADGMISDNMKALYEAESTKDKREDLLSLPSCVELLTGLIKRHGCATIVIDALDECSADHREVLRNLSTLQEKAQNLKIFISSRLEIPVSQIFKHVERIRVDSSGNCKDINEFIDGEFRRSDRRNASIITDKMADQLKEVLIAHAEGM
jgi:Cdc6-like AAA superfamily ATPase